MLEWLFINNIALIDTCNIEFGAGLNILSGETGAGKSIILDSLSFILGARADKTLIRHGENKAIVKGMFNISSNERVKNALDEAGIDYDDELLIQREMTLEGKNTCRINGEKVTLGMLKSIAHNLVDIYAQHEGAELLNADKHISILDNYIGNAIDAYKQGMREKRAELHSLKARLDKIGSMKDVYKRLDILSYEIKEIKDAELDVNEEEELTKLSKKYGNVENILEGLNGAYGIMQGDDNENNVMSGLNACSRFLGNLTEYDSEIEELYERISNAISELSDISRSISVLADGVEYDPYDAKRVEERLDTIASLKRKYGNSIEEILEYLDKIETEYDEYSNIEETLERLTVDYEKCAKELYGSAIALSDERKKYAKMFESDIVHNLQELGMKNSVFRVQFDTNINSAEDAIMIGFNGLDDIVFLISANLGQEPKPLDKIISGGELSRFMLSLKNIIAGTDNIDTMVFDEIDTGISGAIASVVAEKLYAISKDRQVLAVTHLPQLGAMSDSHYLIEKAVNDERTNTITSVTLLDVSAKEREVARLMGGDNGELSIAHARELIANATIYKKSI